MADNIDDQDLEGREDRWYLLILSFCHYVGGNGNKYKILQLECTSHYFTWTVKVDLTLINPVFLVHIVVINDDRHEAHFISSYVLDTLIIFWFLIFTELLYILPLLHGIIFYSFFSLLTSVRLSTQISFPHLKKIFHYLYNLVKYPIKGLS